MFRQFWAASGVRCRIEQGPCVYALARLRGLVLSLRVTPYTALSTGCRAALHLLDRLRGRGPLDRAHRMSSTAHRAGDQRARQQAPPHGKGRDDERQETGHPPEPRRPCEPAAHRVARVRQHRGAESTPGPDLLRAWSGYLEPHRNTCHPLKGLPW